MKIEVKEVIENEDGSATLIMDTDSEGRQFLIDEGVMSILRKYLDERVKNEE